MDCSPAVSAAHGISQARILEWVAISSSRGSSQPKDWTCIHCNGRRLLYHWVTWEALTSVLFFNFNFTFSFISLFLYFAEHIYEYIYETHKQSFNGWIFYNTHMEGRELSLLGESQFLPWKYQTKQQIFSKLVVMSWFIIKLYIYFASVPISDTELLKFLDFPVMRC